MKNKSEMLTNLLKIWKMVNWAFKNSKLRKLYFILNFS